MAPVAEQITPAVAEPPPAPVPVRGTYRHQTGSLVEVEGVARATRDIESGDIVRAFCHDFATESPDLPDYFDVRRRVDGSFSYRLEGPIISYGPLVIFHPAGKDNTHLCMSVETFIRTVNGVPEFHLVKQSHLS